MGEEYREPASHSDGPVSKKQKSVTGSTKSIVKGEKKEKKQKNCRHWNIEFGRKCTNKAASGSIYCDEHISSEKPQKKKSETVPNALSLEATTKIKNGKTIHRVSCPVDSTHTVWEDKLNKHVIHCNAVKRVIELEKKAEVCEWFKIDYNVRDSPEKKSENIDTKKMVASNEADEKAKSERDDQQFLRFIDKVNNVYDKFFDKDLELAQVPEVSGLKSRFDEVKNQKHIIQQSKLIGHLIKNNLFDSKNTYVEFGCGRAEFSRYLVRSLMHSNDKYNTENYKLLLIDRSTQKMKFDTKIPKDYKEFHSNREVSESELPIIERYRVDIKDLKLDSSFNFLEEKKNVKFVGISKHLCGVATDLTLRSILNCESNNIKFGGLIVAMCCRHCCSFQWLLPDSKIYLTKQLGITEEEFDKYMIKMASWATNGLQPGCSGDDGADSHFSGLTYNQRESVGLKVRRIIDESRVYALSQKGFRCQLVKYVDKDISLENHCLIVLPPNEPVVASAAKPSNGNIISRCCIV